MPNDNLFTGKEAQEKLVVGIKKVAKAVGSTMGTSGSNAILEALENPGYLMTNDGYSIANSIKLADPIEELGRKILVESINRANKASGDGSSTTCVLTAATIEEGLKHTDVVPPMDIKRSLEACLPLIEEQLEAQKRTITIDTVSQVASISAEDEQIGQMIQDIYQKIGPTGIIHWDISKTAKDSYTIGNGITIEGAGFMSAYMCDANEAGQNTNQIRLKDPKILITKQKITSAAEFNEIGQQLYKDDVRDVVVFCDEVDPLVTPDIIKTRMIRGFRFILVKMPVIWKDQWYQDLALASGATIVDPVAGLRLQDVKKEHFGTFGHITITKDDTYIDGVKDLTNHIADLNKMADDDSLVRAARLNTKTARYFVGAQSDAALSYRRLKVEDAISAAWQALNGGVVAGGGSALASIYLPDTVGGRILNQALKAPARQIAENSGHPHMTIGDDYRYGRGFNSKTGEFVDMFEEGIVDPLNIVLNACKNAVSVAGTALTAPTIVTFPQAPEMALSQRNPITM